jgi:hypothetical protein
VLDLEEPDLEMRPLARRRGTTAPPAETFYAISEVDGAIASSEADGARATFEH